MERPWQAATTAWRCWARQLYSRGFERGQIPPKEAETQLRLIWHQAMTLSGFVVNHNAAPQCRKWPLVPLLFACYRPWHQTCAYARADMWTESTLLCLFSLRADSSLFRPHTHSLARTHTHTHRGKLRKTLQYHCGNTLPAHLFSFPVLCWKKKIPFFKMLIYIFFDTTSTPTQKPFANK